MVTNRIVKGEFGYFYRGYYIERCSANQWNIYAVPPGQSWSELAITTNTELIDKGLPTLNAAVAEIDSYLNGR